MPLQNRVLPDGRIVADDGRGLLTGNRGILHDGNRRLGKRRWTSALWIACALDYKGRRRVPMTPGTWTELFFLDEAVAFAAGHRPCAECRRVDYYRFRAAWTDAGLPEVRHAGEMDRILHDARLTDDRKAQRRFKAEVSDLPDGTFVEDGEGRACLVHAGALHPFTPGGYLPPLPLPNGMATVLTPEPFVRVLRAGYVALLHPTAS
jgi:hypothetical protein